LEVIKSGKAKVWKS